MVGGTLTLSATLCDPPFRSIGFYIEDGMLTLKGETLGGVTLERLSTLSTWDWETLGRILVNLHSKMVALHSIFGKAIPSRTFDPQNLSGLFF